jgi:PTH1 family peptidyl-tRNA hydrolase
VGFDVIDLFRREINARGERRQDFALVSEGKLGREEIVLAKPQTFMNSSGIAVKSLVSRYQIPLEDLCVIYDDLDLKLGILRIKRKGSAGGHKGMRSIINSLESQLFPRVRIGIGQPPQGMEVIDYVLSRFSDQERQQIDQTETLAVEALKVIILNDINSAMNRFNTRQESEEEQSP